MVEAKGLAGRFAYFDVAADAVDVAAEDVGVVVAVGEAVPVVVAEECNVAAVDWILQVEVPLALVLEVHLACKPAKMVEHYDGCGNWAQSQPLGMNAGLQVQLLWYDCWKLIEHSFRIQWSQLSF